MNHPRPAARETLLPAPFRLYEHVPAPSLGHGFPGSRGAGLAVSLFPVNPPGLRPWGLALSLDGSGSPPHSLPLMLAAATFVEAVESISLRPSQLPWAGGWAVLRQQAWRGGL